MPTFNRNKAKDLVDIIVEAGSLNCLSLVRVRPHISMVCITKTKTPSKLLKKYHCGLSIAYFIYI